jgi:DNA-directed RNA polymerase subunit RPC12/RpoP
MQGVLFKKVLLDNKGFVAMFSDKPLSLKSEGEKKFFVCPHCGARNIVMSSPPKEGVPQIRISHVHE